jgi:hypothetical protein
VSRLRNVVTNAAFAADYALRQQGEAALAETFSEAGARWGGTVNLKRFLESFDAIIAALAGDTYGVERVLALTPRLRNAASSAEWFKAVLKDFDRHEARRRRTRNSLVHGGPLALRTR